MVVLSLKLNLIKQLMSLLVNVKVNLKLPRSLEALNQRKFFCLTKDNTPGRLGNPPVSSVRSLATGHLSVLYGRRPKSKSR
jgi:hypothetical protein